MNSWRFLILVSCFSICHAYLVICHDFWRRKRLFSLINDLPTIYEVVNGKNKIRTTETNHSNNKSKSNSKVVSLLSDSHTSQNMLNFTYTLPAVVNTFEVLVLFSFFCFKTLNATFAKKIYTLVSIIISGYFLCNIGAASTRIPGKVSKGTTQGRGWWTWRGKWRGAWRHPVWGLRG